MSAFPSSKSQIPDGVADQKRPVFDNQDLVTVRYRDVLWVNSEKPVPQRRPEDEDLTDLLTFRL